MQLFSYGDEQNLFPIPLPNKHKKTTGTTVTMVYYQSHTSAYKQTGGRPKEKQQ